MFFFGDRPSFRLTLTRAPKNSSTAALRRWNLSFIHAAPAEAFSKRVTHPERGEMTFKTLVETMGGHDLNHVKQLETIASRSQKSSE